MNAKKIVLGNRMRPMPNIHGNRNRKSKPYVSESEKIDKGRFTAGEKADAPKLVTLRRRSGLRWLVVSFTVEGCTSGGSGYVTPSGMGAVAYDGLGLVGA